MTLAHADAVAAAVAGDERQEDQVGGKRRPVEWWLEQAPGPGLGGEAGPKGHARVAHEEGGKGGKLAKRGGASERRQRARLVRHRLISGNHAGLDQERLERQGKAGLERKAGRGVEARGIGLAPRPELGAQGCLVVGGCLVVRGDGG